MAIRNDPRLIQAHIALFKGERNEAQRLLDEYYQAHKESRDDPLILWLDAQTRATREERIAQLKLLVSSVAPENHYARLARIYLDEEALYAAKLTPSRRRVAFLSVEMWVFIGFIVLGGIVTLLGVSFFGSPERGEMQPNLALTQTALIASLPTSTPLPDMSTPVNVDEFMLRYDGGILQVAAIEDNSRRVVDDGMNAAVQPVPGARFYALRLIFECRQAICNEPPQAKLALRLDDLSVIPLRDNVRIEGTTFMQPVALGRASSGWYVFEIPVSGLVTYLEVHPLTADRNVPPLVILLQTDF